MTRLAAAYRRVRRLVLARRRPLAALAAATAVLAGLQAVAAPEPTTLPVYTAARDLPGGTVLRPADLRRVAFDPATVPVGTLESPGRAVGRTTAGPIRAGEPITDVRLVGGSILAGYPGLVAAPVRIADAGAVELLRVGDRVDVLAADPRGAADAVLVAGDAPVVAVPRPRTQTASVVTGGLVVLAVPDETAQTLAGAGAARYLSLVITH